MVSVKAQIGPPFFLLNRDVYTSAVFSKSKWRGRAAVSIKDYPAEPNTIHKGTP